MFFIVKLHFDLMVYHKHFVASSTQQRKEKLWETICVKKFNITKFSFTLELRLAENTEEQREVNFAQIPLSSTFFIAYLSEAHK